MTLFYRKVPGFAIWKHLIFPEHLSIFRKVRYNTKNIPKQGVSMIQTIQLTPGVVLRHYPDKRFKTAV